MSNTEDYSKLVVWILYSSETPKNGKWYYCRPLKPAVSIRHLRRCSDKILCTL